MHYGYAFVEGLAGFETFEGVEGLGFREFRRFQGFGFVELYRLLKPAEGMGVSYAVNF